jgi:alpha-tubulin suppressor-like RCC1 family protein
MQRIVRSAVVRGVMAGIMGALVSGCGGNVDGGGFGSLNLSLKGAGSLGGAYNLANATFTVTGPSNVTISGDPDTITQSLPVGVYTIKLETGWKLQKTVAGTTTDVVSSLASANPMPFVVNSGSTTNISWLFNVSGASTSDDDLEVVAVSNGALSIALAAGEAAWSNFGEGVHSCAITATGSLRCWGDNTYGGLGYGDTTARTTPPTTGVNVGVGRTVKRVVVGKGIGFTCALLDDATVKCWGNNTYGELGYNDSTQRNAPADPVVNLGSSNTARTIAAGYDHVCVILDSNAVKCWGTNGYGQLGNGTTTQLSAPPANAINLGPGNAAKEIVAGVGFTCALLANNSVKCWGNNGNGELGIGSTATQYTPLDTPINLGTGRTAKRLSAGQYHVCAILDNDTVKCWGYNNYGQLGYGDTASRTAPDPTATVNLGTGRTAVQIVAGYNHTCAQLDDGSIKCWGYNNYGQLGYEDTNQRSAPASLGVNLGTGRVARRLLAGTDHNCALLTDNGLKCWGRNTGGMFGYGTTGDVRGDQLNEMGDYLPETLP